MTTPAPGDTAQPPATPRHTRTGDIRVHEIGGEAPASRRSVLVYLPPSYDAQPGRRFPVLYLHDGQNVFDSATAFNGQEWCVDETAQRLIEEEAIEPLMIVAVANAGERRIDEYTPTRDRKQKAGGGAEQYESILFDEVVPMIEGSYRTLGGPEHTGMGGSSLGALLSLALALRHPDKVGRAAILSPSVWWDREVIVRRVRALRARPAMRLWLSVGTAEGPEVVDAARRLRDALVQKGWTLDQDLRYVEYDGAGHAEQAWAEQMPDVLRFLYPRR